ncbi:uncharacterized protein LOC131222620 [Magnolia sinica]|uniref:uncharacterized protein LOC131222620 n=1 Tax=Magnolia sinica TaxID=86752 RepID=UPI002658C796|nr:uncharacterized protein LOC131222620 [Magnolia sinica]
MLLPTLPSCFNNNNNNHSNSNLTNTPTTQTKMPQNLITTVYQTHICNTPAFLTLTWSKTQTSHSLTINIDSSFSLSISLSPATSFSFFRNKPGSKPISLPHHQCRHKPKLYWDFTRARFSPASAEPVSNFYLAISHAASIDFFIGDLREDALRRSGAIPPLPTEPALLSRREHMFGQRTYTTKARFLGSNHEIGIECTGGALRVRVDGEVGLVVKRLAWKFRGNERISVGGSDVEFYWDVFNWVCGPGSGGGGAHGVFVFQVGDGGVWPEMVGAEKRLMRKSFSSGSATSASSPGSWSVLQWTEERSDGSRSCSSSSSSYSSSASSFKSGGFSLLLYAWRTG